MRAGREEVGGGGGGQEHPVAGEEVLGWEGSGNWRISPEASKGAPGRTRDEVREDVGGLGATEERL